MDRLDADLYNFKRKYHYVRRKEATDKIVAIILIAVLTITLFSARNFIRDMNKFGMWKDGIKSILLLILTNIVLYSLSFANNNYGIFFCGLIISFTIFCTYWHTILDPKNKIYNATIWEENQNWWQYDGWEFEKEVGKLFEACGYNAKVTKGSGDGGVDVILYKDGVKSIVQCKHHKNPVSVEPIRALWGCMNDFSANEAIFIASSGYTSGCYDFVRDKANYKLLTLDDLSLMAAQLHGRLNNLYKNDMTAKQSKTLGLLPLYLLICSIILTCIYAKDYSPKIQSNSKTVQKESVNENTNKTQPAEELVYSPNATKPNENKELVDAQFGDENTDKTLNENPYTTANKQANEAINKGVPGIDALKEPDFGPYMKEMERRIKMNWDPPKGNNSTSVKTKFRIAKDGRLLSYEITQSSGIASTDRAAVEALKLTAPFKPLPAEFKGEWVDIEFTFDYNVLRRN